MFLKTNILRIQAEEDCHFYECQFNVEITASDAEQIESFLQKLDNNLIYSHPNLYANQQLNIDQIDMLLSKGESLLIKFEYQKQISKFSILQQICEKLLRSFQFLPYRKIKAFFNPFEEKNKTIPGLYLQPVYEQSYTGIAFLPVNLVLEPPIQISSSKILLNYTNGRFYERSDIVRVDKQKNVIVFRNGETVSISNLRKGKLQDISGLDLALRIRSYFERVKQNCKIFLQNWKIKLEANFFSTNAFLTSIGLFEFRQKKQKQLNDLVFPMARNTYNHSFRDLFKNSSFEGSLEGELIIIIPAQLHKAGSRITYQLQKIVERMQLRLKIASIQIASLDDQQQVVKLVQSVCIGNTPIYVLLSPAQLLKAEEENVNYFKQEMIKKALYFHILPYDQAEQADQLDIIAYRHLAIIYCKMRLLPWKLCNLPFREKPTMAVNVNVQQTSDGRCSIAIVATLNSFFSKFCCAHEICDSNKVEGVIYKLLQQSLNKFCSIHRTYPNRVFVFRTGMMNSIYDEFKTVRGRLANYYASINQSSNTITYIQLNQRHPFRTYIQNDENHISKLTVNKSQLLTSTIISNRYYLQLQFDQPPVQVQIFEMENDPGFVQRVLQLLARLCYGSVGNQHGKGIGFLGYAAKLNAYKQYDLTHWTKLLQEGVMLFL